MSLKSKAIAAALCAAALGWLGSASAAETIKFNPFGTGNVNAIDVGAFDWTVNNALIEGGNPAGGVTTGTQVRALTHARMGSLLSPSSQVIALPAGTEFTMVSSHGLVVSVSGPGFASYSYDPTQDSYFEMWVGAPNSNPLAGTGYNDGKRIMYGKVTNAAGNFLNFGNVVQFDQFPSPADNNYPGQITVDGVGGASISVQILAADPDYFPGMTPQVIDTVKAFFNGVVKLPFNEVDPSGLFTGADAGFPFVGSPVPDVLPNLGPVNGGLQTADRNFQLQADTNQSFEIGEAVPGLCRVTYGGNDRNNNVDPNKFGEACAPDTTISVKGRDKKIPSDNCYTFGGQVGAPSASSAKGGPFGEHTHHQKTGPAGMFVFRAGTNSAPKSTRIDAVVCKDEGACRQAVANGQFKQIDFEGTGSFRVLDDVAKAYLIGNGAPVDIGPDNVSERKYYFRVDMDDLGEPGNQWASGKKNIVADLLGRCQAFFNADQNNPLSTADPLFLSFFGGYTAQQACSSCPDVYQIRIHAGEDASSPVMYEVRGFLTGGNIQIHRVIR